MKYKKNCHLKPNYELAKMLAHVLEYRVRATYNMGVELLLKKLMILIYLLSNDRRYPRHNVPIILLFISFDFIMWTQNIL